MRFFASRLKRTRTHDTAAARMAHEEARGYGRAALELLEQEPRIDGRWFGSDGWAYLGWDEVQQLTANTNILNAAIAWQIQVNNQGTTFALGNNVPWVPNANVPFSCGNVPAVLIVTSNSVGHHAMQSIPLLVHPGSRTSECIR
jgi:hypothetical protein